MVDPSSAAGFWSWVTQHQHQLRAVITDSMTGEEPVLEELLEALHAADDRLYFLMGGDPADTIELIITPEGNVDAFPAVIALVAAAPTVPGWKFIAFKPAMGFGLMMQHEAATIDGNTAWFLPLTTPSGQLGVRVACADYVAKADEDFAYAAEMLIDAGLGELAARHIHGIDVVRTPAAPASQGFRPLAELGEYVASHARSS